MFGNHVCFFCRNTKTRPYELPKDIERDHRDDLYEQKENAQFWVEQLKWRFSNFTSNLSSGQKLSELLAVDIDLKDSKKSEVAVDS